MWWNDRAVVLSAIDSSSHSPLSSKSFSLTSCFSGNFANLAGGCEEAAG